MITNGRSSCSALGAAERSRRTRNDHVDQIAPSSRSTCRTSLAAIRRTQRCRGPMTCTVAQNSSDEPTGHIDSSLT
jgi:hypothetical protein